MKKKKKKKKKKGGNTEREILQDSFPGFPVLSLLPVSPSFAQNILYFFSFLFFPLIDSIDIAAIV